MLLGRCLSEKSRYPQPGREVNSLAAIRIKLSNSNAKLTGDVL